MLAAEDIEEYAACRPSLVAAARYIKTPGAHKTIVEPPVREQPALLPCLEGGGAEPVAAEPVPPGVNPRVLPLLRAFDPTLYGPPPAEFTLGRAALSDVVRPPLSPMEAEHELLEQGATERAMELCDDLLLQNSQRTVHRDVARKRIDAAAVDSVIQSLGAMLDDAIAPVYLPAQGIHVVTLPEDRPSPPVVDVPPDNTSPLYVGSDVLHRSNRDAIFETLGTSPSSMRRQRGTDGSDEDDEDEDFSEGATSDDGSLGLDSGDESSTLRRRVRMPSCVSRSAFRNSFTDGSRRQLRVSRVDEERILQQDALRALLEKKRQERMNQLQNAVRRKKYATREETLRRLSELRQRQASTSPTEDHDSDDQTPRNLYVSPEWRKKARGGAGPKRMVKFEVDEEKAAEERERDKFLALRESLVGGRRLVDQVEVTGAPRVMFLHEQPNITVPVFEGILDNRSNLPVTVLLDYRESKGMQVETTIQDALPCCDRGLQWLIEVPPRTRRSCTHSCPLRDVEAWNRAALARAVSGAEVKLLHRLAHRLSGTAAEDNPSDAAASDSLSQSNSPQRQESLVGSGATHEDVEAALRQQAQRGRRRSSQLLQEFLAHKATPPRSRDHVGAGHGSATPTAQRRRLSARSPLQTGEGTDSVTAPRPRTASATPDVKRRQSRRRNDKPDPASGRASLRPSERPSEEAWSPYRSSSAASSSTMTATDSHHPGQMGSRRESHARHGRRATAAGVRSMDGRQAATPEGSTVDANAEDPSRRIAASLVGVVVVEDSWVAEPSLPADGSDARRRRSTRSRRGTRRSTTAGANDGVGAVRPADDCVFIRGDSEERWNTSVIAHVPRSELVRRKGSKSQSQERPDAQTQEEPSADHLSPQPVDQALTPAGSRKGPSPRQTRTRAQRGPSNGSLHTDRRATIRQASPRRSVASTGTPSRTPARPSRVQLPGPQGAGVAVSSREYHRGSRASRARASRASLASLSPNAADSRPSTPHTPAVADVSFSPTVMFRGAVGRESVAEHADGIMSVQRLSRSAKLPGPASPKSPSAASLSGWETDHAPTTNSRSAESPTAPRSPCEHRAVAPSLGSPRALVAHSPLAPPKSSAPTQTSPFSFQTADRGTRDERTQLRQRAEAQAVRRAESAMRNTATPPLRHPDPLDLSRLTDPRHQTAVRALEVRLRQHAVNSRELEGFSVEDTGAQTISDDADNTHGQETRPPAAFTAAPVVFVEEVSEVFATVSALLGADTQLDASSSDTPDAFAVEAARLVEEHEHLTAKLAAALSGIHLLSDGRGDRLDQQRHQLLLLAAWDIQHCREINLAKMIALLERKTGHHGWVRAYTDEDVYSAPKSFRPAPPRSRGHIVPPARCADLRPPLVATSEGLSLGPAGMWAVKPLSLLHRPRPPPTARNRIRALRRRTVPEL